MREEEQKFICKLSHLISVSGKHTFIIKNTKIGIKITDLPGSFGFTLLTCKTSKQSTVLLYICEEQQYFSFASLHYLASALWFPNCYLRKIKNNRKRNNKAWSKEPHSLQDIHKEMGAVSSHQRALWISNRKIHIWWISSTQLSNVKCLLPMNMWF